ncbi:TPA: alpha/beta hydrolase [Klebsiella aerogenes]|nr:alpha/beta hydrolase [Klebsiella aerogenes]
MLHTFQHNGLNFNYYDNQADGPVIVFQHGLTGDHGQTSSTFCDKHYRLITLNCRGHGGSDLGPVAELSISNFADDVIALLDHLKLECVSIAGISLGAAMSAILAARHPERIKSVTLVRPAFFVKGMPDSQQVHSVVANYIEIFGAAIGLQKFKETEIFEYLSRVSPDNASSLVNMFEIAPERVIPLLRRMTTCDLYFDAESIKKSEIPFRVIGTFYDVIHPVSKAEEICEALGVGCVDIAYPKMLNRQRYNQDITDVIKANTF